MRDPHFHLPVFARPRLNHPGAAPVSRKVVHLRPPRVLRRADFLALVLAATLATAVVVALLVWT